MAPQLQINQGPQDALLFDNTKSYFTNVPYVRTSNFQMELRDVDAQNTANLGATVNFVVPKAADLLGPVDLMIEFEKAATDSTATGYAGWVESVGLAMIEKITFSVGSHDVEVLTSEHLNIMNELMRSDTHRYGFRQILKTGRPLVRHEAKGGTTGNEVDSIIVSSDKTYDTYDRLIMKGTTVQDGKKLIVPLGLFFTTHPSKYFPLCAVAGCNDVRISIKFRQFKELLMGHGLYAVEGSAGAGEVKEADAMGAVTVPTPANGSSWLKRCQLRCHYIHVTGPEATALMNKEHVRLMKLWHGNEVSKQFSVPCASGVGSASKMELDLSFLHPVQELVITIRKVKDMGSATDAAVAPGTAGIVANNTMMTKNYFAYHGGGRDPNPDSFKNCVEEEGTSDVVGTSAYLKTQTFTLKLNGQTRHLDGAGIDRDYLMDRLMPMLHSNTGSSYFDIAESMIPENKDNNDSAKPKRSDDFRALSELKDRKEIYVYPFALNPEGANPSGSVNFSKVSHAKLSIDVVGYCGGTSQSGTEDFQVDVYGVYYNWLAIKDGRALTSFA